MTSWTCGAVTILLVISEFFRSHQPLAEAARTATMLALLAVALWILGVVAGRAAWRITLIAAMAACLVPLFTIPLARSTFAVQLPPASILLQVAGMVLAAITGLTLWRHFRR